MTRPSPVLLLFAFSVGCATSPAATARTEPSPPPSAETARTTVTVMSGTMNAVGTYDFTAIGPDGSPANGWFTITGSPGAYSGHVERENMGGTELTSIVVDGHTLTLSANIPEGPVVLTLNFVGNDFAGKWMLQGQEGAITGKRR